MRRGFEGESRGATFKGLQATKTRRRGCKRCRSVDAQSRKLRRRGQVRRPRESSRSSVFQQRTKQGIRLVGSVEGKSSRS